MYEKLFNSILYPLYETHVKRRNTLGYLKILNAGQWNSYDELRAQQWQALTALLEHAFEHSPYYKRVFDLCDLSPTRIQTYEDFKQLPICSRDDIVKYRLDMISRLHSDDLIHKSTGGSTGVPMPFALNADSDQWRMAAAQRGYQWAKCQAGQPTVYIWGVDIGTPSKFSKLKTDLYHKTFNRKMFNCFEFDEEEMSQCLAYITKRRPNGIVAFTSAIYNLAKFAEANDIHNCHVPAVITGAEKLHPHQRELIEQVFSTRVFNTYGCREFMLIAAECEMHEGLHATIDNLYVEILRDGEPVEPGESGDVVITDLHNYGMPFIRYKNGDIATQGSKPCSCGRGLPLISDIDGRKLDELVTTNGRIVTGSFFPHLMKEFTEVDKYQVIQRSQRSMQLKLVLKQDFSDERLEFCKAEIKKVFGADMSIQLSRVEDIPLTATGKYRTTISEMSQQ